MIEVYKGQKCIRVPVEGVDLSIQLIRTLIKRLDDANAWKSPEHRVALSEIVDFLDRWLVANE